jgi:aminopeptidase N
VRPVDQAAALPTRFDFLRGAYGPYRDNNDLLYYHLDIRVDPEQKSISGKNSIRFRMLKPGTRIQLDLNEALNIDKILWNSAELKYERDTNPWTSAWRSPTGSRMCRTASWKRD